MEEILKLPTNKAKIVIILHRNLSMISNPCVIKLKIKENKIQSMQIQIQIVGKIKNKFLLMLKPYIKKINI